MLFKSDFDCDKVKQYEPVRQKNGEHLSIIFWSSTRNNCKTTTKRYLQRSKKVKETKYEKDTPKCKKRKNKFDKIFQIFEK